MNKTSNELYSSCKEGSEIKGRFPLSLICDMGIPTFDKVSCLIGGTSDVPSERIKTIQINGDDVRDNADLMKALRKCQEKNANLTATFRLPEYAELVFRDSKGKKMATIISLCPVQELTVWYLAVKIGLQDLVSDNSGDVSLAKLQDLAKSLCQLPAEMIRFRTDAYQVIDSDSLLTRALMGYPDLKATLSIDVLPIHVSLDDAKPLWKVSLEDFIIDGDLSFDSMKKAASSFWDIPIYSFSATLSRDSKCEDVGSVEKLLSAANRASGRHSLELRAHAIPVRTEMPLPLAVLSESLEMGVADKNDLASCPLEFRCAPDVAVFRLNSEVLQADGMYRALIPVSSDGVGRCHAGWIKGDKVNVRDWKQVRQAVSRVNFASSSFHQYVEIATKSFPVHVHKNRDVEDTQIAICDAGYCFNVRSPIILEYVGPLTDKEA